MRNMNMGDISQDSSDSKYSTIFFFRIRMRCMGKTTRVFASLLGFSIFL